MLDMWCSDSFSVCSDIRNKESSDFNLFLSQFRYKNVQAWSLSVSVQVFMIGNVKILTLFFCLYSDIIRDRECSDLISFCLCSYIHDIECWDLIFVCLCSDIRDRECSDLVSFCLCSDIRDRECSDFPSELLCDDIECSDYCFLSVCRYKFQSSKSSMTISSSSCCDCWGANVPSCALLCVLLIPIKSSSSAPSPSTFTSVSSNLSMQPLYSMQSIYDICWFNIWFFKYIYMWLCLRFGPY